MALIKCKSCGHVMSDRADFCPHCGCPKEFSVKEETSKAEYTTVNEETSAINTETVSTTENSIALITKQQPYKILTKKIKPIKDW